MRRRERLQRYEATSGRPLLVLAGVFLLVYAMPILAPRTDAGVRAALGILNLLIWGVFALDLLLRLALADRRWRYLCTHPLDVLAVGLPMLRPLRVLRVLTVGQALFARGRRLRIG